MRGALMRLLSAKAHKEVLARFSDNSEAAKEYSTITGVEISRQLVRYWRKIFQCHDGNLASADNELKESRVLLHPSPNDDAVAVLAKRTSDCILVIPDLHAPYNHMDTLSFLKEVYNKFCPDLIVSLGDELDYHALSFHDSDPDLDSAGPELERGRKVLGELHDLFPMMRLCHSNHGSMVYRRAKAHGIPVQMIKTYRDIVFPDRDASGWSWAEYWKVQTALGTVMFKHQSGSILTDAAHNSCNMVVGHNHGNFSVEYSASSSHIYYGCYSGCLVGKDSMAFAYGKTSLRKPIVGCTVILNGRPVLVPMILKGNGRWAGKL